MKKNIKKNHQKDESDLEEFIRKNREKIKKNTTDVPEKITNSNKESLILHDYDIIDKNIEILLNDRTINNFFRRGNTILEKLNEDKEIIFKKVIRKGLPKFYDLHLEYLISEENGIEQNYSQDFKHIFTSNYHEKCKNAIFNIVYKKYISAIDQRIKIFITTKANGENFQISFLNEENLWLISSKNISMLVRNLEDSENIYKNDRFFIVKIIAREFFNIIQNYNQEKIQQLKEKLIGKTLIGELCGNYKHINEYKEKFLIFFAIVNNNNDEICELPINVQEEFAIFDGFRFVEIKTITCENGIEFISKMKEIYSKISSKTIEQEGEGKVIYFSLQEKVLGICKIKTLEYKIFRLLREKLKKAIEKNTENVNKFVRKFEKESEFLCRYEKPPKNIDFYLEIAENAYKIIKFSTNSLDFKLFHENYINFLKLASGNVVEKFEKEINIEFQFKIIVFIIPPDFFPNVRFLNDFFKIKKIHSEFKENIWKNSQENLLIFQLNNFPKISEENLGLLKKSCLFFYAKNFTSKKKNFKKEEFSALQNTFQKYLADNFDKENSIVYEKKEWIFDEFETKFLCFFEERCVNFKDFLRKNKKISKVRKNLLIFIIAGIPGMGKTTLCEILKKKLEEDKEEFYYKIISNDKIKQEYL